VFNLQFLDDDIKGHVDKSGVEVITSKQHHELLRFAAVVHPQYKEDAVLAVARKVVTSCLAEAIPAQQVKIKPRAIPDRSDDDDE